MKTLYFDCRYGISGDMIVGSLLSCGSNINYVLDALESLNISGYKIILSRVEKGIDFDVVIDDNSDHNMKYLYPNRTFKQKKLKILIKEEGSTKAYLDWRNSIDGEMSEFEKNGQVVSMDEIRKFRSQCDRLGGKMFIVSNSTQKGIEVFAKHYKIDLSLFDGIYVNQYSAEDATKKKIYQQIMNNNNLSNDQIMVIGNSYKQDLAPAKELKLYTFLCKDGFTYDEVVEN